MLIYIIRHGETDGIGNENALAGLPEGAGSGMQLVGSGVHGPPVAYVDPFVGGRGPPQEALKEKD